PWIAPILSALRRIGDGFIMPCAAGRGRKGAGGRMRRTEVRCAGGVAALVGFVAAMGGCSKPTAPAETQPHASDTDGSAAAAASATAPPVDATRLGGAGKDGDNWLSHGRTYDEQRFSPLTQITAANVKSLALAWSLDLDTNRGQEATPLAIDGVLYSTSAWSKVQAIDAVTGKLLWQYDPKVPGPIGARACCDVVNRGVAAWKGRVYVGTLDGRLVA